MHKTFKNPDIDARFSIVRGNPETLLGNENYFMFFWNDGDTIVHIHIDDRVVALKPGTISCTTYLHQVQIDNADRSMKTLLFNREFYCVHTYDSEVSCNGLLFFGSNISPVLELTTQEVQRLRSLYSVLEEEFGIRDANQEEMLRILLKRFIIRCTRLAKKQILKSHEKQSEIDLVRHFNVLVEEHFRTLKTVGEYAELMHKSPKTIANVFSTYSENSPLQVIHNRVIMEAKRMLLYTDKTAKEIGYDLGYSDPAQFSKFFKNHTGMTTSAFKQTKHKIPYGKY